VNLEVKSMKRTLRDAAAAVGGQLVGDDRPYGVVATDSRALSFGALFVALRGPNFDGRDFVAAAAARGAIGAIVERAVPEALPQIVVPDALRALQQLGQAWRARFAIPIVAIGGSNGKTTAKEMTAAILSRTGLCMATHGNLNNHIGVPVTLMRLEDSHRSAVVEMGANRIGDVAELVRLARPTVGLITNAGANISKASAIWTASPKARAKWCPAWKSPRRPSSTPTMPTPAIGAK
jgi:UDP-N-acetylmuramoyl-tripeptide--D-alanyl-D-alanine ligase